MAPANEARHRTPSSLEDVKEMITKPGLRAAVVYGRRRRIRAPLPVCRAPVRRLVRGGQ
jgi:hypothetical protein